MYITYETSHWYMDEKRKCVIHEQPLKVIPTVLPKPEFIPAKLVRVSDMKVVNGSQVNQGYCTLSYSWNQSGDINVSMEQQCVTSRGVNKKEEHRRIDKGKHKIISPTKYSLKKVLNFIQNNGILGNVKYVQFEGIIQQICQQFNIQYIWYDQMCIDQGNLKEKQQEIRNMHLTYRHAYCTVALVPEFYLKQPAFDIKPRYIDFLAAKRMLQEHEYFKRLWTLEEAMNSRRLLFVGKNIHIFSEDITYLDHLYQLDQPLCLKEFKGGEQEILYYAHQRTSTKDHDFVFALINLFPDIMDQINIDYDQPIEELMIQFYGLLASKSLGILGFKKFSNHYISTIQKYKSFLPSWTGVNGEHRTDIIKPTTSLFLQNYKVIGKTMCISCAYITNNNNRSSVAVMEENNNFFNLRKEDLPPFPSNRDSDNSNNSLLCCYQKHYYRLGVLVQITSTNVTKTIRVLDASYVDIINEQSYLDAISDHLQKLSRFLEIKKKNLYWYDENALFADIHLNDLTEDIEDDPCTNYVILSGIEFKEADSHDYKKENYYCPVLKKKHGEEHYKAIGTCMLYNAHYLFSDCNLSQKTFSIQ